MLTRHSYSLWTFASVLYRTLWIMWWKNSSPVRSCSQDWVESGPSHGVAFDTWFLRYLTTSICCIIRCTYSSPLPVPFRCSMVRWLVMHRTTLPWQPSQTTGCTLVDRRERRDATTPHRSSLSLAQGCLPSWVQWNTHLHHWSSLLRCAVCTSLSRWVWAYLIPFTLKCSWGFHFLKSWKSSAKNSCF